MPPVQTDLEVFWYASDGAAIVAAYAGEFLPGDVRANWTGPFRDEARTWFVTATHRAARTHADAGRHRLAIEVGRRLEGNNPYDHLHELVVDNLIALGEAKEAERARIAWDAGIPSLDA